MPTHLPTTEGSTNEILSFVTYGVYFSNLFLMMYTCRHSTGLWHASLFSAAMERIGLGFTRACSDLVNFVHQTFGCGK